MLPNTTGRTFRFSIGGEIDIGYYLILNDMRNRLEKQTVFGPYESHSAALAFHDGELAEAPWNDVRNELIEPEDYPNKRFGKAFKKGSILEWMNPLLSHERERPGSHGHGVRRVLQNLDITSQARIW